MNCKKLIIETHHETIAGPRHRHGTKIRRPSGVAVEIHPTWHIKKHWQLLVLPDPRFHQHWSRLGMLLDAVVILNNQG